MFDAFGDSMAARNVQQQCLDVALVPTQEEPVTTDTRQSAPRRRTGLGRKREQQDSRLYNLKLDIIELKQQIQRYTSARDILVSRALNRYDDLDGSSAKAVVEYFRVFRHGLQLSPIDAIKFVHEIMAEDIVINHFAGRDLVIEQWKTHSMCFANLDFRVLDTVVIPLSDTQAIVKCNARSTATISRLTLALLFPHILDNDRLATQLEGRTFESAGQYDFVYDSETQQFVRCEVVMDLMGALAKLVRDPRDLALLFNQAMLTDEFYIGDTTDNQCDEAMESRVHTLGDQQATHATQHGNGAMR